MAKLLFLAAALFLAGTPAFSLDIVKVQGSSGQLPPVEYGDAKLPPLVKELRQKLIDAAKSGDIERLAPLMKQGQPDLGYFIADNPVDFLRSQSGDEAGREVLAILLEILEAGYVHTDIGTEEEAYVWPYFTRYPLESLNGRQMVELFKLITAGDLADMRDYGAYIFYRTAIKPDGSWLYFIAGD